MDLQDFEKLARRSTGLVAMQMLKDVTPHPKGSIAGFLPKVAKDLADAEQAVPLGADGKPVKIGKKKAAAPSSSPANPAGAVKIPDNWQGLHHLQLLPIASEIAGKKVSKKEEAIAVIELELKRRAEG